MFKSEGEAVREVKSGREGERERERGSGERYEGEARSKDKLKPLRILSYTICDFFFIFLRFVRGDECDVSVAISYYKCLVT